MKKTALYRPLFITAITLALLLAISPSAHAQKKKKAGDDKKKLEKEWKNKAKAYSKNPLALKSTMDNNKKQVDDLLEKNATLSKQLKDAQSDAEKTRAEVTRVQGELQQAKAAADAAAATPKNDDNVGMLFKVQIGAFKNFDMAKYVQQGSQFDGEVSGGMNKFTIGKFRDIYMAEDFRKDLEKAGVRGAWTVPFKDGVRIEMKDAKAALGLPTGPLKPRSDNAAPAVPADGSANGEQASKPKPAARKRNK